MYVCVWTLTYTHTQIYTPAGLIHWVFTYLSLHLLGHCIWLGCIAGALKLPQVQKCGSRTRRLEFTSCLWSTLPGTIGCVMSTFCRAVSLPLNPLRAVEKIRHVNTCNTEVCVPAWALRNACWVIPWDLHSTEGHAHLPSLSSFRWQRMTVTDGGHDPCPATSSRVWSITVEVWVLSRVWP